MTSTISVKLKKPILKDLFAIEKKWQIDRNETIRRLLVQSIKEWKIKDVLEKIALHKRSIGKAAKECDLSLLGMVDLVKAKNVDWTGYSKEDLERDLELLK